MRKKMQNVQEQGRKAGDRNDGSSANGQPFKRFGTVKKSLSGVKIASCEITQEHGEKKLKILPLDSGKQPKKINLSTGTELFVPESGVGLFSALEKEVQVIVCKEGNYSMLNIEGKFLNDCVRRN